MIRRRLSTKVAAACAIIGGASMLYHAGRHASGWLLGGIAVGVLMGSAILIIRHRRM